MSSKCYLVAGLGKTGHSIARYLQRKNYPFVVYDTRESPNNLAEFKAEFPQAEIFLKAIPDSIFQTLEAVIASPGVSLDDSMMKKAKSLAIPIYGDIECLAKEILAPVIAITGTNGKSTVTTLVGEIAKAAGFNVAVAGNIGTPVLDLLALPTKFDLWVLELSSFQLDLTTSLAPISATILNVSPDHLDRHHTLEAYIAAKQRIYMQAELIVYNRDDAFTYPIDNQKKLISFGLDAPKDNNFGIIEESLILGNEVIIPASSLKIKGCHNWLNALAASALVTPLGIAKTCIEEVLEKFSGLPHRTQWIKTIDGVDWINDSKGTNIGATLSAISGIGGSMQGRIVLIAGGQGKGADFTELAKPMADFVRSVVLIGEDADKIAAAISSVVPVLRANSLEDAVVKAKLAAKAGDVVLLSPACASFDMFRDFNHRGEMFAKAVDAL